MFMNLALKANKAQHLKIFQTYLNLALKVQSQSRTTTLAIAELKFPKQVIVTKQANIASGAPQQVNNHIATTSTNLNAKPRAREKKQTEQNELLEQPRYEQKQQWMDAC